MEIVIVLLILVAVLVLILIALYNRLVQLRVVTEEAWSNIDVQLKKRYDLIPNLVETVKGYATHEKEVFENVTKARSNAMQSNGGKEQGEAEGMLSGALKSLFAVAESYPDLKANTNFLDLQQSLKSIETEINNSRTKYNACVKDFNIMQDSFPGNIFAGMFGFTKRDFFEVSSPEEKENVKVKF